MSSLFFSYSHKDVALRVRLEVLLSALEWVSEGYKECKSKAPTVIARLKNYRFVDYKDEAIDRLQRVTRGSVETQAVVEQMRAAAQP